ncbi:unnamed protein product [Effrenium voratum]|nr:unnamed protein product [Effrenium voratum]
MPLLKGLPLMRATGRWGAAARRQDLQLSHTLVDADSTIKSVAWAPDGRLAAGSSDGKVRVYDQDLRLSHTLADADDCIQSVAWAPDGRLAASSSDKHVRVYDQENAWLPWDSGHARRQDLRRCGQYHQVRGLGARRPPRGVQFQKSPSL